MGIKYDNDYARAIEAFVEVFGLDISTVKHMSADGADKTIRFKFTENNNGLLESVYRFDFNETRYTTTEKGTSRVAEGGFDANNATSTTVVTPDDIVVKPLHIVGDNFVEYLIELWDKGHFTSVDDFAQELRWQRDIRGIGRWEFDFMIPAETRRDLWSVAVRVIDLGEEEDANARASA